MFTLNLVFGKQDVQCDIMLHAHLKVEAFPHTALAWLWQLGCLYWLVVSRIEKLPQKLPTASMHKFRSAQSRAFLEKTLQSQNSESKFCYFIFFRIFSTCISIAISDIIILQDSTMYNLPVVCRCCKTSTIRIKY